VFIPFIILKKAGVTAHSGLEHDMLPQKRDILTPASLGNQLHRPPSAWRPRQAEIFA
jgi:hypothetical protein